MTRVVGLSKKRDGLEHDTDKPACDHKGLATTLPGIEVCVCGQVRFVLDEEGD
jgi:hypothetical protein